MAENTVKELAQVDKEYAAAFAAFRAAKARYTAAGAAREQAHVLYDLKRSQMAQQLRGLSDEQWAALRQHVDSPLPFNATIVPDPSTE